ncbi:MAG: hypothetical protein ACK4FK_10480 [Ferrovibrio sp.]|uniref:hypothetical protein n=1 Tax=Ferrovibrio sp. TaxID=1917215 RepID=UPI00391B968C
MFCETEAETFADPARELIFQIARGYLERRGVTATELVFDPVQHRALLNDGPRFQEILQRVALLQGQHTKRPVSERMKELTALAEAAMRRVEVQAAKLTPLSGMAGALQQGLLRGAALDEWVRDGVVVARLVAACDGWEAKAQLCLDLAEAGLGAESHGLADRTLAEILLLKPAAPALFGEASRRRVIDICLGLAGEELPPETPAVLLRLRHALNAVALMHAGAAVGEKMAEALDGSLPLFGDDAHQEWEGLQALRQRIEGLPLLEGVPAIQANLARRFARFATPELLNPILGREPDIARKLLFLLRLYREVEEPNARFELQGILSHYMDHRDFRTQFLGPQATREEFATLAAAISEALVKADIPDPRKTRLLDQFRHQLAGVVKPNGQRNLQRGQGGPNDVVIVQGMRIPLRNWSPVGLLFGPCPSGMAVGDRLPITVEIRNAALSLDFRAEAEVLRVTDDVVAARYACDDPAIVQRIKSYFAG